MCVFAKLVRKVSADLTVMSFQSLFTQPPPLFVSPSNALVTVCRGPLPERQCQTIMRAYHDSAKQEFKNHSVVKETCYY